MPTSDFPTSIDTFTTKTNNVDTIDAAHINKLQDAAVEVETILGASSARRTIWTPTVAFTANNTGMTYTSSGFYARFGSLIYIYGEFTITAKGSADGDLRITNPPVAGFSGALCTFACSFIAGAVWTTVQPHVGRINGSVIDFFGLQATTWTRITHANVLNSSAARFSGFYFHA